MKEALKLALEALEGLYISSFTMPNSPISIAITAIKAALAQPVQQEHDVDATIIQYHEATIKRLEKRIEELAQPAQEPDNGDELTIAYMSGVHRGKELAAQPAPLPYMHSQWQEMIAGIPVTFESEADAKRFLTTQPAQEPWCMKMNGCTTKCEDCPDEPAQEPVAWLDEEEKIIYWHNTHETDDYHGFRRTTPLYTTPQQRPWVGLTHDERYECIHGESVDAWDIAEAVEAKLKEQNT